MNKTGLALTDIAHRYDASGWELAVDSFELSSKTFVGVIGPNGSGKSTLLRIAAGALAPERGDVLLDGKPLAGWERRSAAKRLGYLPQDTAWLFDYTVEEVAGMGRYPHATAFGALGAADHAVVDRCLRQTELERLRRRPLSHLSGGERKRALLASVLSQEPSLMLLDEPTAALDLQHQVRFFRLLRELAEGGMGVAAVTHDVNLAALFCNRIVLMRAGRFVAAGAPAEVLIGEHLNAVYGAEVLLSTHPETGTPLILPRRAWEGS